MKYNTPNTNARAVGNTANPMPGYNNTAYNNGAYNNGVYTNGAYAGAQQGTPMQGIQRPRPVESSVQQVEIKIPDFLKTRK